LRSRLFFWSPPQFFSSMCTAMSMPWDPSPSSSYFAMRNGLMAHQRSRFRSFFHVSPVSKPAQPCDTRINSPFFFTRHRLPTSGLYVGARARLLGPFSPVSFLFSPLFLWAWKRNVDQVGPSESGFLFFPFRFSSDGFSHVTRWFDSFSHCLRKDARVFE